jgi:hypothetical protein
MKKNNLPHQLGAIKRNKFSGAVAKDLKRRSSLIN